MAVKSDDTTTSTRVRAIKVTGSHEFGSMTVADVKEFAVALASANVPNDTIIKVPCTYSGQVDFMSVRVKEVVPVR